MSSLSTHAPSEDRDFVTALARGLDVINSFSSATPEMTLSEISQRTGLNVATVRRSLITLEHLGYVRRQAKSFLLTPKVLSLGANYFESMNLKDVAQPQLASLVERFHDASSLTVLDGFEVVYVAHVASDQRVPRGRNVGTRLPAHATSTGLVLLANSSPQHQQALLSKDLAAYTTRTPVVAEDLKVILARAREDGYVIAKDTLDYGNIALAVPVRDSTGRVVAALNCATRSEVVDEADMLKTRLPALREMAEVIGQMLHRYPALAHSVPEL